QTGYSSTACHILSFFNTICTLIIVLIKHMNKALLFLWKDGCLQSHSWLLSWGMCYPQACVSANQILVGRCDDRKSTIVIWISQNLEGREIG
uniref:Uncharacterized protein n=1 Tax=Esox lucius TaxID=8010 RepID=A0A3P8YR74_ESOLU